MAQECVYTHSEIISNVDTNAASSDLADSVLCLKKQWCPTFLDGQSVSWILAGLPIWHVVQLQQGPEGICPSPHPSMGEDMWLALIQLWWGRVWPRPNWGVAGCLGIWQ